MQYVKNEKMISVRLITINIKEGKENKEYTLIVGYGPNEDTRKEGKDKFFKELQEILDTTKNKIIIILGDLNGRVGNNNRGIESSFGKYGEHTKNHNGERIIEFCLENELKTK